PIHGDVAGLQGRQSIAVVLFGIVVVAYPDEGGLQEMHDSRKDFRSGKATQRHMLTDLGADRRKCLGECYNMLVFRALAHLAETRMVSILLATFGIAAGCLDVTVRKGTDPHVRPRRRDGKRFDPAEDIRLCEPGAVRACVAEPFSRLSSCYARSRI